MDKEYFEKPRLIVIHLDEEIILASNDTSFCNPETIYSTHPWCTCDGNTPSGYGY